MKRTILTLLAILISNSAAAEWTRVGGGDDDSNVYVDLETFRRNGDKVKLWSLRNFKTLNGVGKAKHLSNKTQWEIDCKEEQVRMPAYMEFSGRDGSGQVVTNDFSPNDSWIPVAPGTIGQMISEIGCDTTIGTNKWTLVKIPSEYTKENPHLSLYFDYSNIQRNGNRVSMWRMLDVRKKNSDPKSSSHSVKFHMEHDCIEQKTRTIRTLAYPANMGIGKKIELAENIPTPWNKEEGFASHVWKVLCETPEYTQSR
jgi:hypothetical protein